MVKVQPWGEGTGSGETAHGGGKDKMISSALLTRVARLKNVGSKIGGER